MNILETDSAWYCLVNSNELMQGDILENCPIFFPTLNLTLNSLEEGVADFEWEVRDVIIMSQSCDLAIGKKKCPEVLLCPLWNRSELTEGPLSTDQGMEGARKGQLPAYHVLNKCEIEDAEREFRVVDFRYTYTLPLDFCKEFAARIPSRIRLVSPYREKLSQAFARFFMRVGLPTDIPPFK